MIQDAEDVLRWSFEHCKDYGGDPDQIVLVGQSAGAHLGMMAVLRRHWNIKGFVGLSGAYDMRKITRHFARHGLPNDFVQQCLFQNRMDECDPTILLLQEGKKMPHSLPPIELWHGTGDKTVELRQVLEFSYILAGRMGEIHSHMPLLGTIRRIGRAPRISHLN
jgi:prenylcysteine alpha-carboxyl methylesterase